MARILEEKRGVCEELRHDKDTGSGGSSVKRDTGGTGREEDPRRATRRPLLEGKIIWG